MKETESIQTVDTNIKIPFWKAACFGLGDFGNNFVWTFVGSYLMIFYTDVFGIPMAAVSLLMLIARAWDAINDPIIGGLSDRTRTRWGRYRPWVLLMSFPTAIITVLTFWAHPDWSNTSKIVYMYVTYALLVFCYTGVNIPYNDQCFNSEYGRTGEAVHYADHPCQYLYCRNWDHRYSHGLCFGQRGCRDGIPPDCGHFCAHIYVLFRSRVCDAEGSRSSSGQA